MKTGLTLELAAKSEKSVSNSFLELVEKKEKFLKQVKSIALS